MRKKTSGLMLFLMLYSFNVNADDLKVLHKIEFNKKAPKELISLLVKEFDYDEPIPKEVHYEKFDLNNDKSKEYFLYYADSAWCGSHGCSIKIISKYGSKIISLLEVTSSEVYILNHKTKGYYDIAFNVNKLPIIHIWNWNGSRYE